MSASSVPGSLRFVVSMRLATIFCALGAVSAAVLKEPRTGIGFQEKRGGGTLGKLGVRTKGPIKVYAVGEYDNGDYVLKMSYGVSAAKMVSALGDALKPRCGDAKMIEKFEECLLAGLPDGSPACRDTRMHTVPLGDSCFDRRRCHLAGAPKGTQMTFSTGGGSLKVTVHGMPTQPVSTPMSTPMSVHAHVYVPCAPCTTHYACPMHVPSIYPGRWRLTTSLWARSRPSRCARPSPTSTRTRTPCAA